MVPIPGSGVDETGCPLMPLVVLSSASVVRANLSWFVEGRRSVAFCFGGIFVLFEAGLLDDTFWAAAYSLTRIVAPLAHLLPK